MFMTAFEIWNDENMDSTEDNNEQIPVIGIDDIERETMGSSGKGGQNVNKRQTKVRLRFDIDNSAKLSDRQKETLKQNLKPSHLARGRYLVVYSQRSRKQEENIEDALAKMNVIIAEALLSQKERKPTKTPRSAKEKRIKVKKHHGRIKEQRGKIWGNEE